MRRIARSPADLKIRAVRGWPARHGAEAPHLALTAAERAELARLAEVIEYRSRGSQIFLQGAPAGFIHLLAEGVVRSYHMLPNGERQILAFHWPGDLFGLAENDRFVNSAETVLPSVVYRFAVPRLSAFLRANPALQEGFLVKAMHDLRNTQRQLIVMGRFDIARRLAAFLLDCSGHETYYNPGKHLLTLPMNRYDIADYLGTSVESISRSFGRLEKDGLLRRQGAEVELKPAKLKALVYRT